MANYLRTARSLANIARSGGIGNTKQAIQKLKGAIQGAKSAAQGAKTMAKDPLQTASGWAKKQVTGLKGYGQSWKDAWARGNDPDWSKYGPNTTISTNIGPGEQPMGSDGGVQTRTKGLNRQDYIMAKNGMYPGHASNWSHNDTYWQEDSENNMASVTNFVANYFNKYYEPLTNDRFLVSFPLPRSKNLMVAYGEQNIFTDGRARAIAMYGCRNASLPGRSIATYQWNTHGTENDYPYNSTYDNIDLTFFCTGAGAQEKRLFDGWMAEVIHPNTMSVGYKDDYITNISIGMFNMANKKAIEIEIEKAYPVTISAIELGHDSSDYTTFTVSFAYDKWKYKAIVD